MRHLGVLIIASIAAVFFGLPATVFAASTGTVTATVQVRPPQSMPLTAEPKSDSGFPVVLVIVREGMAIVSALPALHLFLLIPKYKIVSNLSPGWAEFTS